MVGDFGLRGALIKLEAKEISCISSSLAVRGLLWSFIARLRTRCLSEFCPRRNPHLTRSRPHGAIGLRIVCDHDAIRSNCDLSTVVEER